jgi:aminopeptidase C
LYEGDRDFRKTKSAEATQLLNSKLREEATTTLYPLKENNKVLELSILRAEMREDLK